MSSIVATRNAAVREGIFRSPWDGAAAKSAGIAQGRRARVLVRKVLRCCCAVGP